MSTSVRIAPLPFELGERLAHGNGTAFVEASIEMLFDDADAQAFDRLIESFS